MKSILRSFRLDPELDERISALRPHLDFSTAIRRAVLKELPNLEREVKGRDEVCARRTTAKSDEDRG